MNIVILSEHDWCASGMQIRNALRSKGHGALLIKNYNHNGYECDYELPKTLDRKIRGGLILESPRHSAKIQRAILDADIAIFKGDEPPTRNWHRYILHGDTKIVFLASGSNFRRKAMVASAAKAKWKLSDYDIADLKLVNTPEMQYPGFKWMPMSFDSDQKPNLFTRQNRQKKPILIMHSPSNRERKGTEMFIKAMEVLRAKGYAFKCHIIEGRPVEECIRIKSRASIFYDQNKVGFYGNSAIEAMQYGIPTMAWISPEAIKKNHSLFTKEGMPIINCGTSLVGMIRAFEAYLQNPGKLYRLSQRTKKYTDRTHSYEGTAERWEELLSDLL